METVGDRIKDIRKRYGISQEAIAHNICTQSEISRIENNKNLPSYTVLYKIAQKLGVDLDYLLVDKSSDNREDYLSEVKEQLKKARRVRDYKLIQEIVAIESKAPIFKRGENYKYLKWHEATACYHLNKDKNKSLHMLKTVCLSESDIENVYTELDLHVLNSIGIIYRNEQELRDARVYLEKANEIIYKTPNLSDIKIKLKIIYNLSKIYTDLIFVEKSIDLCKKGMQICIENESSFLLAEFHYQVGRNYLISGNENEGLQYWNSTLNLLDIQENQALIKFIKNEINYYKANKKVY
ncbi:helix-turn-helix domain-containing protein [Terrihalobacillus insolitus]|uniref:helix-turn-helix domain-containing protein n=1 Tax=Terrihalobacillus insolitus TaxID=2950438 RepID=UPI0023401C48|nr:helix-turn-helix domain-containing protein [Terrihalobacillus insolitus]MDC3413188.1 helix-turn-helix domain-containing protein [Terrihalobacillus insolitus]